MPARRPVARAAAGITLALLALALRQSGCARAPVGSARTTLGATTATGGDREPLRSTAEAGTSPGSRAARAAHLAVMGADAAPAAHAAPTIVGGQATRGARMGARLKDAHRTAHGTAPARPVLGDATPAAPPPSAHRDTSDSWFPRRARARADTTDEPVLLELRLGQLASRTVEAYRAGDAALLPLSQFFDLAQIRATLTPAGRLEARLQPGNRAVVVDAHADSALAGHRVVRLAPGSLRFLDGELFLSSDALGALLDLRIAVDWPALEVTVTDPDHLPLAEARRRAAARAALRGGLAPKEASRQLVTPGVAAGGVVLDYSIFAPSSGPVEQGSVALAAGAELLGGALQAGMTRTGFVDSLGRARGDVRVDASWLGVWRDNPWIRQLRVGDGGATGPRARALRGIAVTNAPYLRPTLIGTAAFAGQVPAGWAVEAYRAGQLVGFDSTGADGAFRFDLPVAYGDNPVDFVAYGPYGERRVLTRLLRVPAELLPAGRFEYGLSGGACRFAAASCRGTGNADLRYGLTEAWTLEAGVDYWRDSTPRPFLPYAGVSGRLTGDWTVQADGMLNTLAHGAVAYAPSVDRNVRLDVTRYADGVSPVRVSTLGRRSQVAATGFLRPWAEHQSVYFEGRVEVNRTVFGANDLQARIGAAAQAGDLQLLPYVRVQRWGGAGQTQLGLTSYLLPRPSWGALFRGLWLRGNAELEDGHRPSQASLAVARTVAPTARAEVGVSWIRGAAAPTFTLSLSSLLGGVRSLTTATAQAGTPGSVAQLVQGSVLVDQHTGRVGFAPGPALQRGGIAGVVYLDENGNGRRDADEPGLPRVRVQVGSGSAISDSLGRYRVWDVVPFEPVTVAVDSLSFDSPLWLATWPTTAIVPAPNRFTTVDLPLVMGGVIEGRVLRGAEGSRQGVGGVPLALTERRTGVTRTMVSFSDGTFYLTGVRPGDYELTVARAALEALGAAAEPRRVNVATGGAETPPVDVVLVPRP